MPRARARTSVSILLALKTDLEAADDEQLALRELQALAGVAPRSVSNAEAGRLLGLPRPHTEWAERSMFACEVEPSRIEVLRQRLAFWGAIYHRNAEGSLSGRNGKERGGVVALPTVSRLLEATVRINPANKKEPIADQVAGILNVTGSFASTDIIGDGLVSPAMRRKNDYLTHPLHKYKAKFFPRLARSLVNVVCPEAGATVLDPFSGSGTAPLEASLMGLRGIGFDIDPLSVFIGRVKCELEELDADALVKARDALREAAQDRRQLALFGSSSRRNAAASFKVPAFLIARRPARFPPETVAAFEADTNALLGRIRSHKEGPVRDWLLLALSHALATKISLRWMGTGDDRFALEVAKRSLISIFNSQLDVMVEKLRVYQALRQSGVLTKPGPTMFGIQNATASPLSDSSVDGIVTSPPYLPAASGRETYLRSRAISLVALGFLSEEQVLEREKVLLGSILASPKEGEDAVPASVQSLASWMAPQRARGPKALPTRAYFENIAASLREMRRVLRPGGRAAIVVSKYHRFYELESRKVVREFDMSAAVAEVASTPRYGVGLGVDEIVDIELPKMDYVARPGAKGTYHESIVFLRKA